MQDFSCPKCGFKREPGAAECSRCGIIFEKYEMIQRKKAETTNMIRNNEPHPKKNTKVGKIISICIAILGILISTIGLYLFMFVYAAGPDTFLNIFFCLGMLIISLVWLSKKASFKKSESPQVNKPQKPMLVLCKTCQKEVSITAKTCPLCGQANPSLSNKKIAIVTVIVMIGMAWIIFPFFSSDKTAQISDAVCMEDLSCWANRNLTKATYAAIPYIERMAKYSSKWTDDFLETKFSHHRWMNQEKGTIIYIGDKIQFQNGFGAWQNYIYECDFDPQTETILDVRVKPGHL